MAGTFIIKYTTSETLDHNEAQVTREKPATLDEFKNKIAETIQKYFGEFSQVYESQPHKNKITKTTEHSQTFLGNGTTLSITEKVKSDEAKGLVLLFNTIFENDNREETIIYNTIMRLRRPQQGLYLEESQPAIKELIEILESQKAVDKDAKIKYNFSIFS